ncbi:hypothetical protein [Thermoleptolyngbya sp.]
MPIAKPKRLPRRCISIDAGIVASITAICIIAICIIASGSVAKAGSATSALPTSAATVNNTVMLVIARA